MKEPDRLFFDLDDWRNLRGDIVGLAKKRIEEALYSDAGDETRMADHNMIKLLSIVVSLERDLAGGVSALAPSATTVNILTYVSGLPPERAQAILVQTIRQLEQQGLDSSKERGELVRRLGEKRAGKLLAIEANGAR